MEASATLGRPFKRECLLYHRASSLDVVRAVAYVLRGNLAYRVPLTGHILVFVGNSGLGFATIPYRV